MTTFRELQRPRVLLVALSGIGNLLMASPMIRALKDANPTTDIDVLVAPRGTDQVLAGNPRVGQILHGTPKPTRAAWHRMVTTIRRGRYDIGIVAHPGQLVMSASLLFFGGVRRRIGYRYTWGLFRHTGLFLNAPVELAEYRNRSLDDRRAHDVVQNLALMSPLDITAAPAEAAIDFPLAPDDRARADAWLAGQRLSDAMHIGIHPGAHADLGTKRWPAHRWSEIGDRLAERYGATILVFGGPEEYELKTEVCARMRRPALSVEAPLRTTAALIARCAFFVSNDSGLMHVAVSQNVPTFGLFGPTDERRTAPWGPTGHVIRAPGTVPSYEVARVADVRARTEPDPSLEALGVDLVVQTISAALPVRA